MPRKKGSKTRHVERMESGEYDSYVEHPRYGKRPRYTGLNPETDFSANIYVHWHSTRECRIPNTAIAADLSRQREATLPVTHYYDVKRQCRDCGSPFIFFAQEQKHWYEELKFPLEVDCVRCIRCRKQQQGIERKRQRYEELFHVLSRSPEQDLEMAECCVSLIEEGIFSSRQTQQVRTLLRKVAKLNEAKWQQRYDGLRNRLAALETASRSP